MAQMIGEPGRRLPISCLHVIVVYNKSQKISFTSHPLVVSLWRRRGHSRRSHRAPREMDHDQHENDDAQRRGDYCPCGGGACARLHDAAKQRLGCLHQRLRCGVRQRDDFGLRRRISVRGRRHLLPPRGSAKRYAGPGESGRVLSTAPRSSAIESYSQQMHRRPCQSSKTQVLSIRSRRNVRAMDTASSSFGARNFDRQTTWPYRSSS
jgi:hypothetical protein